MRNRVNRLSFVLLAAAILSGGSALCCLPALAQVKAPDSAATPAAPATSTALATSDVMRGVVIGPGDTLHVVVYNVPEMEQRLTVSDSGNANFTLVGEVHVAGMTASQASEKLVHLLDAGHLLVNPNVTVTIEQSATMQVSVIGEVRTPGTYEIGTARSILDIISLAGGLTDAADRNITIKRRQGPDATTTVFVPNNANDAIAQSVLVYPGDTVVVPHAGLVYVLGDVNKPGGYYMQRDSELSVLQAIGMAGGLPPNAAAPRARIVRKDPGTATGYVDIPLPLRAIQEGKKPDLQLRADDVIYVPFSYGRNFFIQTPAILASAASALIYAH